MVLAIISIITIAIIFTMIIIVNNIIMQRAIRMLPAAVGMMNASNIGVWDMAGEDLEPGISHPGG